MQNFFLFVFVYHGVAKRTPKCLLITIGRF